MTSKERVLATIQGKPVDKIPVHHVNVSGHAASIILGRKAYVGGVYLRWEEMNALWNGPDAHREFCKKCDIDALDIAKACGHDVLRLQYWRWPAKEKPVKKLDERTFLFGDPNGAWYTITYLPKVELFSRREGRGSDYSKGMNIVSDAEITEESLTEQVEKEEDTVARQKKSAEPLPNIAADYRKHPEYLVREGTEVPVFDISSAQTLMAVATWPSLMRRLLVARARGIAAGIPRYAASGMQVNFSGWDFCSNHGPMVSPAMLREVLYPALKIYVDACHAHGITTLWASDGDFWPVADDFFVELGFDGWFEVDKSTGMDLRALRAKYPNKLFIGNMRVQLIQKGTPEEVRREVMETMEVAHELGGIIAGCSNLIMPGTPPENITMLLKTIEEARKK